MKSNKTSVILNSCIGAASIAAISFSALFTTQNPQIFKFCYPFLAAIVGISSVGVGTSFLNLKNTLFPNKYEIDDSNKFKENQTEIEPIMSHRAEETITDNHPSLDNGFVSNWKTLSHQEKTDFVSQEFFSKKAESTTTPTYKSPKTK